LLNGGELIICPEEIRKDFEKLYNYLIEKKITIFFTTNYNL
jgi:hypothetical protein